MRTDQHSRASQPPARRVPPPVSQAPGDALPDSRNTLDELPGPQPVVLWNACRAVMQWASVPAGERAGLLP